MHSRKGLEYLVSMNIQCCQQEQYIEKHDYRKQLKLNYNCKSYNLQ